MGEIGLDQRVTYEWHLLKKKLMNGKNLLKVKYFYGFNFCIISA